MSGFLLTQVKLGKSSHVADHLLAPYRWMTGGKSYKVTQERMETIHALDSKKTHVKVAKRIVGTVGSVFFTLLVVPLAAGCIMKRKDEAAKKRYKIIKNHTFDNKLLNVNFSPFNYLKAPEDIQYNTPDEAHSHLSKLTGVIWQNLKIKGNESVKAELNQALSKISSERELNDEIWQDNGILRKKLSILCQQLENNNISRDLRIEMLIGIAEDFKILENGLDMSNNCVSALRKRIEVMQYGSEGVRELDTHNLLLELHLNYIKERDRIVIIESGSVVEGNNIESVMKLARLFIAISQFNRDYTEINNSIAFFKGTKFKDVPPEQLNEAMKAALLASTSTLEKNLLNFILHNKKLVLTDKEQKTVNKFIEAQSSFSRPGNVIDLMKTHLGIDPNDKDKNDEFKKTLYDSGFLTEV